jgi:hypothetical protein
MVMKASMPRLLLGLWGLLGLVLLLSYHAVEGRKLQSNSTVFVPGLFDMDTFDFGEEVS